jgi:hypothetical protein
MDAMLIKQLGDWRLDDLRQQAATRRATAQRRPERRSTLANPRTNVSRETICAVRP